MNQFVDEYSKGPYIGFRAIEIINQSFRTHINRTSNSHILENFVSPDGKAEIAEFISVLMDKNIRYFKITVDDAKIGKILQCLINREDNFLECMMRKLWYFFDVLVKISALADLSDDVAIIDTGVNIVAFDNIGMGEHAQDIDLTFEQPPRYLALDVPNPDLFNRHLPISQHINPPKHLTKTPLPQLVTQFEQVVLHFLHHLQLCSVRICHYLQIGYCLILIIQI
jgi:hypothetical protein